MGSLSTKGLTKREARRKRDREDFVRTTTQAVTKAGLDKPMNKLGITDRGVNAGHTYREHLENEIERAVVQYRKARKGVGDLDPLQVRAMRGVIRGLCRALLIYEDSYHMHDKAKLAKLEKEFLNDV